MADTLPADPARRQERLKLQIAYAQTLSAVRTPGAPETAAAFARARELAEEVHDSTERLSLSYGHWASCFVRGELAAARALAATITDSTDSQPNSPRASVAHRVLGMTACIEGNLVESRTHLEQSVAAYRQSQRDDLHLVYGHDAGVAAMGNLALVLWQTGEVRRACALADDVIRITREGRHIPTMLYGYFYKSLFEAQRYDATCVAPSAGALFDLCHEHFPRSGWLAGASFMLAWSRLVTARDAAGLTDMRRSIAFFREQGLLTYPTLYRAILARTEIRAGDPRAALATLEETIADADRTGLQWWRPELLRLRAEALWEQDPSRTDEAAVVLEAALQHARDQSARSLELRAALSLARLYRATGRAEVSRALLQPVLCAWRDEQAPPEAEKARRLLAL